MSQKLEKLFDGDKRVADFYFDVRTDVIYLVKSSAGKKDKISSGIKRPNIIHAKREAFRKLKLKINKARVRTTPLIKDELPPWREMKSAENLSPRTMVNIDQAIKRIEGFWGSMFPHEVTRPNIAKWYAWLEVEYPGELKEKPIKYLRNFSRYLAEKTHNGVPLLPAVPTIANPDFKQVKADRKRKKGRIFTAAEFKQVYGVGSADEKLVAMFMYTMATRIEETLTLRFGHEIIDDKYVWSHGQNKADLDGSHLLHKRLLPLVEARKLVMPGPLLFPQRWDKAKALKPQQIDWADWRKRADLGWHWTSHTFRHTCLSNLFSNPSNPQTLICKLYRVSMAVAMDVYIHPTKDGVEKMRDALEVDV